MFRTALLASSYGVAIAMPACTDKTILPTGSWVLWNSSVAADVEPAECKAITNIGDKAPAACCPDAKLPFAGISFEGIIKNNSNGNCAVVPEFNNAPWYARCMADGLLEYGEQCVEGCGGAGGSGCKTLKTDVGEGCYLMNSLPGTHIFIKSEGCGCAENINNNASSSIGEDCPSKEAPKGLWTLWNTSTMKVPDECTNIPWQERAPDNCCTNTTAMVRFANLTFEDIVKKDNYSGCALIPEFGNADWHAKCKQDGDISYGEDCDEGCETCGLMATYRPGCYAAASFPGSIIFMHNEGCNCVTTDDDGVHHGAQVGSLVIALGLILSW